MDVDSGSDNKEHRPASELHSIYREWLPADLPAHVAAAESGRFRACYQGLQQQWEANSSMPSAERSLATLDWRSLSKRRCTAAKTCKLADARRDLLESARCLD